ncbi:copper homeostasis membrane protein CopD [Pseudomonas sp. Pseu.R1]|uniref:copper homeostasis membrane protein CopD n=1 Tax=Pseudomonas sp. Pseu.R1 TaxID=3379818 RepID=UPI003B926270
MHEGLILCRFLHFGAVLLLFGSDVFRYVLFKALLPGTESRPARWCVEKAQGALAAMALLSALGWLMLTAANMADDWHDALDLHTNALVLGHTFFGHVWGVHLLLSLLALICLPRCAPRHRLLISTLLLLTLAPVGHGAMFDGTQGALLIVNQMLHLIGTGTWLGGLLMLTVLLMRPDDIDLRAILARFSGIGYALVAVIIVTGMINVRALSGGFWPDPALAGFGQVLAIKVAMVLCMLALAGLNRSLARAQTLQVAWLRVSVVLEGLFGAAALAAVSLLGTLPPMLG